MDKFHMDEDCNYTHALPMCAVWDHISNKYYSFGFEIYGKDNYGNVDFDDYSGGKIKMSELEKLGRNRLPDDCKDMELFDMYFKHSKDCLCAEVVFVEHYVD